MLFWPLLLSLADGAQGRTPRTRACCAAAGVSAYCAENFCDVERVPDYFTMFKISSRCARHLGSIARCLADGRNHAPCCLSKSRDYLSCLHLCNGTEPAVNSSTWSDSYARYRHGSDYGGYVSCLSFNMQSMFTCMLEGYASGPSPPVAVSTRLTAQTAVEVTWRPPEKLSSQVKEYVVSYHKTIGFIKTTDTVSTQHTALTLRNLSPDTKYEVSVVAKAKTGLTDSLPSDVAVFVTKGIAPKVTPYVEDILTAHEAVVTLVCTIEVYGSQHISDVTLEWLKFSGASYRPLDTSRRLENNGKKYVRYSYPRRISPDGRNTFVLSLKVTDVESSDFGSYKCLSRTTFGEDSAVISVRQAPTPSIPNEPRNVTACCLALPQNRGCEQVCVGLPDSHRTSWNCAVAEAESIMRCAIEGFDLKPCCLREKVPEQCLSFCDGTQQSATPGISIYRCFEHASSFTQCHAEAMIGLPNPPSNLEVSASSSSSIHVSWQTVANAESYVVYYRKGSGAWMSAGTVSTSANLRNLRRNSRYQVLVLSSNRLGFSENSKPKYISLATYRSRR